MKPVDPNKFCISHSGPLVHIIGFLNFGRTQKMGKCSVVASEKGYKFIFRGKTVAVGKTPEELCKSWDDALKYYEGELAKERPSE